MNTDEGRRQYVLNIQQIAQCVNETNNYDVLSSLLHCREYEKEWEKRHSMIRTPWTELGKREVMEFGIVQKDFRGFEILHEKYKHRLARYGVSPNMWIFPPGMALYASMSPAVTDYDKQSASVTLNSGPEALGSFRGINVYETREFDVRQGELPINLLSRRVQIGELYFMRNHHSNMKDYATDKSMDVVVYNEKRDDWEKISYRDAFDHCDRFDAAGNLNKVDFGDDAPPNDLFTYKMNDFDDDQTYEWCHKFGQMEPRHMPIEAIRAFCDSYNANDKATFLGSTALDCDDKIKSLAPKLYEVNEEATTVDKAGLVNMLKTTHGMTKVTAADIKTENKQVMQALKILLEGGSSGIRKADLANIENDPRIVAQMAQLDGIKTFKESDDSLEGADLTDPKYYIFLHGYSGPVKTSEHLDEVLEMKKPLGAVPARVTASSAESASAFEPSGAKRTRDSTSSWSSKRSKGVADFTERFASAGAQKKEEGNPNSLDDDGSPDVYWSTADKGFTTNGKREYYLDVLSKLSPENQKVFKCLYISVIHRDFFAQCLANNVVLPVSIIIARPHMTYDMSSCIMMKGGSDTGATYQGHSDFQLGDDVQSKIHYGNYTYYSKAVVTNHKNIIVARNVFSTGYQNGNDCDWCEHNPRTQRRDGSMYAFMVPYNEFKKANPLRVFSGDRENDAQSMTGANFYARVHGHSGVWDDEMFTTMSDKEDANDVCYVGHHFWWKQHREATGGTTGSYTGVTINTGHWGQKVYPGCGLVRNGNEVYFRDTNYGQVRLSQLRRY